MFDRHAGGERAILVHVALGVALRQSELNEFKELAESSGVSIEATVSSSRHTENAKTFIGKGKVDELADMVAAGMADVVIFNHDLSPGQERTIEKEIKCRVLSRSGLILDIFAARARTFEGKLQVELAQLQHLSTRLVRGWTHLERQKGGIGLRGPGETQLETDRRLLAARIKSIHTRLKKVRKQREQNRLGRKKSNIPTVSIVGYTNAGKSTLFNALVNAGIYAEDRLFATLDPTMRRLDIPGAGPVILADTVGFIRNLPHQLIEAFRATLEETVQADLLVHVIDLSSNEWRDMVHSVNEVIAEINADHIPVIRVFNKIDKLESPDKALSVSKDHKSVWVSAKSGQNLLSLQVEIATALFGRYLYVTQCVQAENGALRAKLYALSAVEEEYIDKNGACWLTLRLLESRYQSFFGTQEVNSSQQSMS